MSSDMRPQQPEPLETIKMIAGKLAGAQSGATAALYGLPAGNDTLRQALKRCNELYDTISNGASPEQCGPIVEQLQADVYACAALGAISGQESDDTHKLIDNLWNQIDRKT